MARFLLDHNLSPRVARLLEASGHQAATARQWDLGVAADREILRVAAFQGLVLLTEDRDFIDLHRLGSVRHAGILVVPQAPLQRLSEIASVIVGFFDDDPVLEGRCYLWRPNQGWEQC